MKISLLHPSRSRPEMAFETYLNWMGNKCLYPDRVEYILSVDCSDPKLQEYVKEFVGIRGVRVLVNNNNSAIEAINVAAKACTGDLIVVCSDDFDAPHKWDVLLSSALHDKSDFIVKTKDGIQEWIITLPIVDKIYYERFGYIYPPHIRHMFADTWMSHVADLTDRKIEVDLLFRHLHYTTGAMQKDEINIRNDSSWADGEAKYLEGIRTNFGLKPEDIKGELKCDDKLLNWIKERL